MVYLRKMSVHVVVYVCMYVSLLIHISSLILELSFLLILKNGSDCWHGDHVLRIVLRMRARREVVSSCDNHVIIAEKGKCFDAV